MAEGELKIESEQPEKSPETEEKLGEFFAFIEQQPEIKGSFGKKHTPEKIQTAIMSVVTIINEWIREGKEEDLKRLLSDDNDLTWRSISRGKELDIRGKVIEILRPAIESRREIDIKKIGKGEEAKE